MVKKVFINYRRDDVPGDARGIRDALAAKFGRANIFMDVDNLLAGQRFDRELAKALSQCDVLIVVIGPKWMDLLRSRAQSSERDYVREEIAAALVTDIVVIPVRAGREGNMPTLPALMNFRTTSGASYFIRSMMWHTSALGETSPTLRRQSGKYEAGGRARCRGDLSVELPLRSWELVPSLRLSS